MFIMSHCQSKDCTVLYRQLHDDTVAFLLRLPVFLLRLASLTRHGFKPLLLLAFRCLLLVPDLRSLHLLVFLSLQLSCELETKYGL